MVSLCHVSAGTAAEDIAHVIHRDGAVIVDDVIELPLLDTLCAEMQPFIGSTSYTSSTVFGLNTRRTGGLAGRSSAARTLMRHPLVLGIARQVITQPSGLQLHNTEVITIDPGEPDQVIHRDQDVWGFPFPSGYEPLCSMMLPLNGDFTIENGATRVVPGSHKKGYRRFDFRDEEIVQAEMKRGSALFWTGSLYHGGGANKTDRPRQGVMVSYSAGWLRQEENQYLAVPHEIARDLDDDMLRLMGYDRTNHALGNTIDRSHPLSVFRPQLADVSGAPARTARDQRLGHDSADLEHPEQRA